MRNVVALLLVATLAAAANAAGVDPGAALTAAKTSIAAKNYAQAVSELEPAIASAATIADQAQQKQALTALHFYAAVAYSGMRKDDEAAKHLQEALRLTPAMRAIDRSRYDARFVALFERVRGDSGGGDTAGGDKFESLYPGFSPTSPLTRASVEVGNHPAIDILGSKAEKREWRATNAAGDRAKLLDAFWAARDKTPSTPENEFRDAFERRLAFADTAFGAPGERGATTDRGRVFMLLGPPALVRRRALSAREASEVQALSRNSLDVEVGTVEYWIYRRDQLPVHQAQPTVTFRFISHQGLGTYVLQKDGFPMNTLTAAANASVRE